MYTTYLCIVYMFKSLDFVLILFLWFMCVTNYHVDFCYKIERCIYDEGKIKKKNKWNYVKQYYNSNLYGKVQCSRFSKGERWKINYFSYIKFSYQKLCQTRETICQN